MTRIEALRTLTRYMPQRSIHITESLDSCYHLGDRRDNEMALVTVSPGITKTTEPECFAAPTIETAVQRALDAIGSITFLNHDHEQAKAFERLNCEHKYGEAVFSAADGKTSQACLHCGSERAISVRAIVGPLIESGFDAPAGTMRLVHPLV